MLMQHPILHFLFAQKICQKWRNTTRLEWFILATYVPWIGAKGPRMNTGECHTTKNENGLKLSSPAPCLVPSPSFTWQNFSGFLHELREWCFLHTLQGINISHLGKRKIISKMQFFGDMLVPWRVSHGDRFHDSHQLLVFLPLISLPQSMEHSPSLSLRSLECWHNNNLLLFPCQFPLTKNYLGDFGLGIWPGLEDPWWLLKEFNKDGPSAWQLPSSHCSSISRDKDGCTPAPVYPWYLLCSLGDSWGL